jgi:hypothetical protein
VLEQDDGCVEVLEPMPAASLSCTACEEKVVLSPAGVVVLACEVLVL